MAISNAATRGDFVVAFLVFLVPILAYVYMTRKPKNTAGPLPPSTEITKLFIHPIKSCHGIEVKAAKILPTGLDLDRQWMWVSYPDYKFLTIRQTARMTLIRTSIDTQKDTLTVTAPAPHSIDEKLEFSIPAHPSKEWLAENTDKHEVEIWNQKTPAHVYSTKLTSPFNAFFGKEVRLVYKYPYTDEPRLLLGNGAKEKLGRDGSTCFPDMAPILAASESSFAELNSRLKAAEDLTIDIRRFRPNIVVKGDSEKPWDEDRWKTIQITHQSKDKSLTLDVIMRCARCHVPNVDPDTAEQHKRQPWSTMIQYRKIDEGISFKPCFGMLGVPRETGEVRVGM